ncbi:MAG: hypothetical protein WAR79_09690 [Melioribacteraceae bacterium]
MNSEIVIVHDKLTLVMQTVFKIIKTIFHSNPLLLDYQSIINDERNIIPKLLLVDHTIFNKNINFEIEQLRNNFPNASIIVISLDNNQFFENIISKLDFIELLNIWNCNQSIAQLIATRVENKLNIKRFN